MGGQVECPASVKRRIRRKASEVNVLKKLQNPFALVIQGFIAGGLLFWTTQGQASQAPVPSAPSAIAITAN